MTHILEQTVLSPLKWAGGKRWLAARHRDLLPTSFDRYVEPFLGGGSVFIALAPDRALLTDANSDLIEMYRAIRDNPKLVQQHLETHAAHHGKRYYYEQRSEKPSSGKYIKAAWFLYMNRACYNGLYRVNKAGDFNVPKGSKTEILLESDNFQGLSELLAGVDLGVDDFEATIDKTVEGDFLYADPPYTVKHNNNGFNKYNEKLFSWEDQERLMRSLKRAVKRGVAIAVSNANHYSISDLYDGFGEHVVLTRHSTIGGRLASRDGTSELFIRAGYGHLAKTKAS